MQDQEEEATWEAWEEEAPEAEWPPGYTLSVLCRNCAEPIFLVYTTQHRWMPVDVETIEVDHFAPVELVGITTKDGEMLNGIHRLAVPRRATGRRFHWQTCPDRRD